MSEHWEIPAAAVFPLLSCLIDEFRKSSDMTYKALISLLDPYYMADRFVEDLVDYLNDETSTYYVPRDEWHRWLSSMARHSLDINKLKIGKRKDVTIFVDEDGELGASIQRT